MLFSGIYKIEKNLQSAEKTMHFISAIIVGKYLILQSLPVILDVWELIYKINNLFDVVVKISNLLVIINR